MDTPVTANEALRVATLKRYRIMDTAPEMVFNELAQLAAYVVQAPMAAIAFVDQDRLWYKAQVGMDMSEVERKQSICAHTLLARNILLVPDARTDKRFERHISVISAPHLRFYAGIPLRAANNQPLGTLCVMDQKPRELSSEQVAALRLIGRQIMMQLESRLRQVELQRQVLKNQSVLNDTQERLRNAVTQQLTASTDADESRERFRFLTEHSNDMITRHSPDGTFIYISPAVQSLLGYDESDLVGKAPFSFYHPDDIEMVQQQLIAALAESDISKVTLRFRRRDGDYIWLETISRTIRDTDSDEPIEIIANSRDVTARVVTEQALRESEARFRRVVDQAADAMFLFAPDGQILDVNQEACHVLSYRREELIGRNMSDVDSAYDEQRYRAISELEFGDSATFETEFMRKEKGSFSAEVRIGRLDSGEYLALVRDITIRAAEQRAVAASERQFRALAEGIPDFVTIVDMQTMDTLYANRGAFLGYRPDQWRTHIAGQALHHDHKSMMESFFAELPESLKAGQSTIEFQALSKAGAWEWIQLRAISFEMDADGNVTQAVILLSDITDRARMKLQADANLRRRDREISMSRRIAREIASQPTLAELYRTVVDLIKGEFDYFHVQMFGHDPSTDSVYLLYGYGDIGVRMLEMNHTMPVGVGPIGVAAVTGESVLQPRLSLDPSRQINPLLSEAKGELAVPIMVGDQLLGVLDILSANEDELTEDDRVAMEAISNQVAIAVDSTRLRRELEGQLRELNHLQRLMSREGWQNFQQGRTQDSMGYLFDKNSLESLVEQHVKEQRLEELKNGVTQTIVEPIAIRGEIIGHLGIQQGENDPLDQEDRELLAAISVQVAEAMENARLLEQTQKRAVELETVAQVSAATATILESEQLLQDVVDLTKHSFDLYHAHIYLLEPETEDLVLTAGAGRVGRRMAQENWRIPLHQMQSIVARAAREKSGVVVNDVTEDSSYLPNLLLPETRAELAVPMIAGNALIGVLDVQSDRVNAFSAEDVRTQSSLASQIAVALQNAILFEEQLETAEQLREVDKLKSEFLASMSHELRTPLNSIIGFADVLLEGLDGDLTPRMEEDVKLIRSSGAHLRDLIGEILDMSKIEAGKMELRYEQVDFRQLSYEVLAGAEKYAVTHEKTHLTIMAELDEDVHFVEADRTRMVQILNNLVSNAIKFTDEGGVTLKATIQDDMLKISVEDTGIGLSAENMDIVFEQFRQVGATLTGAGGSTGLGLPITKSLVELHGGEIWATSEIGNGSSFIFTIPLKQVVHEDVSV